MTSNPPAATSSGAARDGWAALLRERGLHVTGQRVAVLAAVAQQPHCTADEALAAARERLGAVSRQAVYDSLAALTEAGILRRIAPVGAAARYETRVGDNHHHLVCRDCRVLVDVDCAAGAAPCLTPVADHDFVVEEAEVVYWGRCPGCAGAQQGSGAAGAARDHNS